VSVRTAEQTTAPDNGSVDRPQPADPRSGAVNPIRVLVAGREQLHLSSLTRAVTAMPGGEVIGCATDGYATLEQIRRKRPQVAVLDPDLDGLSALEILNAVERDGLPTRVVIIVGQARQRDAYEAIAAGARGYLTRRACFEEVRVAIDAAAADSAFFSPPIQSLLRAEIRRLAGSPQELLDPVTREVLQLTAAGLSPSAIAARMQMTSGKVKGRLQSIYKRFGVNAATAAVAEGLRRKLID
jgi:two-component system nitrate/nitrite response regulator NarL